MNQFPKISIVTPSFNQAQFLEQTILSVLNQRYPNLEYIIMDGGSADGSADILRKYENRLKYWISEPDNGQADAIYRGFEHSTGEILAWLNSDDYYLPGALHAVGHFFAHHPQAEWLIGNTIAIDANGQLLFYRWAFPVSFGSLLYWDLGFHQQASFWRREAFFATGGFDRTLTFSFDYDLYLRLARRQRPRRINRFLAAFRKHPMAKTGLIDHVRRAENETLFLKYGRYSHSTIYQQLIMRKYEVWETSHFYWREFLIWAGLHVFNRDLVGFPKDMSW
jgi:glycosyltransferase involved in cell wall biosynthesis